MRSTIVTARTPESSGGSPTSMACWSSRASMTWPTDPGTTSLSAPVMTCNGGRSSSPSCAWSATTIGSASRWKTSPCRPRRASSRRLTRCRRRSAGKGVGKSSDMTLLVTIACAPCCWGVDDVSNPHLPHWERVLDEAAEAGFGGLELGPYGYMPLDAGRVATALGQRRLSVVAGTIFDDLVSPANRQNLLRQTDEICALVTSLPRPESHPGQRFPAPYLTVMDWGHEERDYAAGHPDRAPRLDPEAWDGMVANVRAIAEL